MQGKAGCCSSVIKESLTRRVNCLRGAEAVATREGPFALPRNPFVQSLINQDLSVR